MTSSSIANHFRLCGYAILPGRVSRDLVNEILTRTAGYGPETRIEDVVDTLHLLPLLKREERVATALSPLVGENIVILRNRHNHLTATSTRVLRAHRIHADSKGFTCDYLTLLVPIAGFDDSSAWPALVPGSHMFGATGPDNGGGRWLDEAGDDSIAEQLLQVPLRIGDALLIDPRVYHRAGSGTFEVSRTMLTLAIAGNNDLLREPQFNHIQWMGSHQYSGHSYWQSR